MIPPNSDNILQFKVINKIPFIEDKFGNKKWLLEESDLHKTKFGMDNNITFHAMVGTKTNPFYINTYRSGTPFSFKMKDAGIVPGLKQSLKKSKKGR